MAEIVLFHHAMGLRPGVLACADRLRAAGHVVHTPDVYDGNVFDDLDHGMPYVEGIGFAEAHRHAGVLVAELPSEVVYAGFSLGGWIAENLAASRPGAQGALLFHAGQPLSDCDADAWPASVPMQVHYAIDDPWIEVDEIEGLRADVGRSGAELEVFTYPGDAHLFTQPDLDEHDPAAAELVWSRALDLLARIDATDR